MLPINEFFVLRAARSEEKAAPIILSAAERFTLRIALRSRRTPVNAGASSAASGSSHRNALLGRSVLKIAGVLHRESCALRRTPLPQDDNERNYSICPNTATPFGVPADTLSRCPPFTLRIALRSRRTSLTVIHLTPPSGSSHRNAYVGCSRANIRRGPSSGVLRFAQDSASSG